MVRVRKGSLLKYTFYNVTVTVTDTIFALPMQLLSRTLGVAYSLNIFIDFICLHDCMDSWVHFGEEDSFPITNIWLGIGIKKHIGNTNSQTLITSIAS